jgi:CO dehydrogenase maturation factor
MKIIISGKGGSGKSTISALLALALKNLCFSVLLVDADESNEGLHRQLGISYPVPLLDSLGGKKGFRKITTAAFPQTAHTMPFKDNMRIKEIPGNCIAEADGIKLLVIGKIRDFGEGCACPMGALSRMFLSKLDLEKNEIVIVDAAAGVEHFGRRIDADCDMILCIVDPTYESFLLARKMHDMAGKAEVDIFFVLNKVDEKILDVMKKNVAVDKLIAIIPYMPDLFIDNLEGITLKKSCHEIEPVCQLIEKYKNNL